MTEQGRAARMQFSLLLLCVVVLVMLATRALGRPLQASTSRFPVIEGQWASPTQF